MVLIYMCSDAERDSKVYTMYIASVNWPDTSKANKKHIISAACCVSCDVSYLLDVRRSNPNLVISSPN